MSLQFPESISHPWWINALVALISTGIGGGALKCWQIYAGRREAAAREDESRARVRQMDSQQLIASGHVVVEMIESLRDAQSLIKSQAIEIITLRTQNEELAADKMARELLERELDDIKRNWKLLKPPG